MEIGHVVQEEALASQESVHLVSARGAGIVLYGGRLKVDKGGLPEHLGGPLEDTQLGPLHIGFDDIDNLVAQEGPSHDGVYGLGLSLHRLFVGVVIAVLAEHGVSRVLALEELHRLSVAGRDDGDAVLGISNLLGGLLEVFFVHGGGLHHQNLGLGEELSGGPTPVPVVGSHIDHRVGLEARLVLDPPQHDDQTGVLLRGDCIREEGEQKHNRPK